MSSDEIAISARGIGKAYVIPHSEQHSTLAEELLHRLLHPRAISNAEQLWALRDVSFDVYRGEIIGVVGGNGAGKSTLLKILSQITEPTTGEARLHGRVGSLIEVGTGFHQELTGRENIYLNGAILGMRRKEVVRRFDEIVEFSGVEKFLDTPVKRYSSGMYIRLAFAVAAHLDTDILLVDEVLSVGDAEFQKKSLGRLDEVAHSGRTVLCVSHNAATLEALCSRGLMLHKGQLLQSGAMKDVLAEYHRTVMPRIEGVEPGPIHFGSRYEFFRKIDFLDEENRSIRSVAMGAFLRVRALVESDAPLSFPIFTVRFYNLHGQKLLAVNSPSNEKAIPQLNGLCELTCDIDRLPFAPGEYRVKIGLCKAGDYIEEVDPGIYMTVRNADTFNDGWGAYEAGVCVASACWKMKDAVPEAALLP